MKKRFCGFLAVLLFLSAVSCQSGTTQSGSNGEHVDLKDNSDSMVHTDPQPLRTVEYSVMYRDRNTGLTSYDTATLEQTDDPTADFIVARTLLLSELPISVRNVTTSGKDVCVDFDSEFFVSVENTEKNEASLLDSIRYNLLYNIDSVETVRFCLDGGDFITAFHAFSSQSPFTPEILDLPYPAVQSLDYQIVHYDMVNDRESVYSEQYRYVDTIDPSYFISRVSDIFNVSLAVNAVTTQDGIITVDFASDGAPCVGLGAYEESRLLDSLCALFLQIYPQADAVCLSQDGNDYNSGHILSERTTPYATRTTKQLG